MAINITLNYTERARAVMTGAQNATFHYEADAPFPQTGDFLENELPGGPQTFIVIGRVFRYRPNEVAVSVYLDLPPEPTLEQGTSGPELSTWEKLGG
ncbi:hypothetical protein [Burkholderia glumae]|uniref:Uncharacterized protein n=1 Tax=Burkholderia glumae TaxID=337 RepID=A0AAP9Y3D8_BURGL|nr:hypothetical protein [Burkholderia glumae]ACR29008.1 Hypothetical protein bglu_1g18840 [Burkholderia glumae BGR1]AJY65642.1 hypothetical protein KS03_2737 [Burkholderia glumae LMG 2196 = ATCC 33617]KHJ62756.1 hypothetical protein NCPPB3923_11850 [Burkholderia glumae]MCM2483150.1 hypothetical protein [Burkholderia glumae]MCM2493395.1 hypothetical protein [Burkholderia glumae]